MATLSVIGAGRAGASMAQALEAAGWTVDRTLGRTDDPSGAAAGVDLLLVATPDVAIASVAAAVTPNPDAVVAHLAGSLGLDALAPHQRRAAIHPLVSMPDVDRGAARLAAGAWFAIAGDPMAARVVADLGGRTFVVADADRAAYHAAAVIASNHLVALMGQVERLADRVGVPFEAYLELAQATLANVAEVGPAAALTGPAARGDWSTLDAHRAAIAAFEREAYDALAAAARRLAVGEDE